MSPSPQLSLSIGLRDEATFDNYWCAPGSVREQVVAAIRDVQPGTMLYLWGGPGSGRTHLLEAACHDCDARGQSSQFLPLDLCAEAPAADLLDGLDANPLVCLSNIQAVAGRIDWEEGLFNLYNRIASRGHRLLLSGDRPPQHLPLDLPDLHSRLTATVVFRLPAYDDDEKRQILCFRAARLGLELGEEVAQYLITRAERTTDGLMDRLARLDKASLAEKRRLTVPFVRQVFGW